MEEDAIELEEEVIDKLTMDELATRITTYRAEEFATALMAQHDLGPATILLDSLLYYRKEKDLI